MSRIVDTGDIEFEINLINFSGDQILDIKPLLIEFNIYGDIFNTTLKSDFFIKDSVGIIERFPIVGDEKVIFRYKTAGERKFQTFIFDIYKITNRAAIEERSHAYVLECVTRETIINELSIEDRAFVNESIGSIVQKVWTNNFGNLQGKELIVEPETQGFHSFIAPKQTPFQFINMLASEARSPFYPDNTTYVFYEDAFNFHFTSLGYLFENVPVDSYYLLDPSVQEVKDNKSDIKKHQTIIDFSFESSFDTLSGLNNGMYRNNIQTIDTVLKRYQSVDYSYLEKFFDQPHVSFNPTPYLTDKGTVGNYGKPTHQRFLSSRITSQEYATESYLNGRISNTNDPHLHSPRTRQKFLGSAINQIQNFSQYNINVVIPGDYYIQPGYLVNIYLPQNSDVQDDYQKYLKLFGQLEPLFLITAVRHSYRADTGKFNTTMNVTKESFGATIKSEYDSKDQANEVR